MSLRHVLMLLGLALITIGIVEQGRRLLAVWLGADLLALGIAHAQGVHGIFGKRLDGSIGGWRGIAFLPLSLFTYVVWAITRWTSREPAQHTVSEDLVVGRRLLPGEYNKETNFANYVDLTAEFSEPPSIRRSAAYVCFPILDGSAPTPEALFGAVKRLRVGKSFVHCAQGHGRTGLFALAMLLHSGRVRTVSEGLEKLQSIRPGINLTTVQRRCIEAFAAQLPPS